MRIQITLPRDRRNLGRLRLFDGDAERFGCPCYAKADSMDASAAGNPTRDPTRRNGDTPTGKYDGTIDPHRVPTEEPKRSTWLRKYGQWQTIRMTPTGGDALTAHNNGRRGLLIHGGWLSPTGTLRATNGCVRIEDKHQNELLSLLRSAGVEQFPIEITEA